MELTKKIVKENIFNKHFGGYFHQVRFSDLPKDIRDDDIIDIERIESHYSENNSWDEQTILNVIRERPETTEEQEKRMEKELIKEKEANQRAYEAYLRLKKRFEPLNT